MKRLIASSVVLAAGVAFLVGCGDENTTEITQVVGMQVVEAGESMPKCTADNEGAMVYSVDSAEAYYCVSRKWTTMKGEKGEDGKKGTDGESGSAGADGKDGKDGKDGSSCTAKALKDGKGYKIVCGGDSVGVVMSGAEGAQGIKGDSGATGDNGLSAYEIAKAGGYTGTEEQWIASLKGEQGVKGDSGIAGTSCTAEEDSAGVKITCTDGKTYTLNNGTDGKDGRNFDEGWMVDHRDYHIYKIVTIGTQTWMAENLNYETATGSYCYKDSAKYCEKYGRLYTWAAAMDSTGTWTTNGKGCGHGKTCSPTYPVRGVCPEGWHLPTQTEWNTLFTAVGGQSTAGKELKSTSGWYNSGNGTDAYSFSALPAGYRGLNGGYNNEGLNTYFWSSTESNSDYAYYMFLDYYVDGAYLDFSYKNDGFSVRCIKD